MTDLPEEEIRRIEQTAQNILLAFLYSNRTVSITKPDVLIKQSYDWAEAFARESRKRYRRTDDKSS